MIIIDYIERIQNLVKCLEAEVKMLEKYYNECDYEMLVSKGGKSIRTVSDLYSQYRELLLSLYRMIIAVYALSTIIWIHFRYQKVEQFTVCLEHLPKKS